MPAIHVDRLTLKLEGLSERDGRRLALLVAEALGTAGLTEPVIRGALQVRLEPRAGEGLDALARRIAADVLRELGRSA